MQTLLKSRKHVTRPKIELSHWECTNPALPKGETACQAGLHNEDGNRRQSWGHAMAVDPWGKAKRVWSGQALWERTRGLGSHRCWRSSTARPLVSRWSRFSPMLSRTRDESA